jgi:hypothetical protein
MRGIVLVSVLVGCFGQVAFAGDASSPDALAEQMTYFYLEPSEESFAAFQQGVATNFEKLSSGNPGFTTLMSVFLGKVHEKHGWPLADIHDLDDQARAIANHDASELSRYVWDDTQVDPGKLDVWWASFFATGNTRYLENLIGQLGDLEAQRGAANIMVMGAANWSFNSNCRQHSAVLMYAKSVLRRNPPVPNHDALKEIVEQAEKPDG